jgi:DNA processing protein
VEAARRSGSLITARMALEQGRGVAAVPGSVAGGCHCGCHALIKDGARLVESVEDVLDELRWPGGPPSTPNSSCKLLTDNVLLSVMAKGEALTIDQLVDRTGSNGPALLADLGRLEVTGCVERVPGGMYVRLD